jgi:CSLREA domain-containing protein
MIWRIIALLPAVVVVLALSGSTPATAGANIIPSKLTDSADGDCDPTNDCSLREAIIEANNTPGRQIIQLSAGTYSLTLQDFTGGDDDLSAIGDLDITDDVAIVGAASIGSSVISQDALGRVTEIFGPAHVDLIGVQITNGKQGGIFAHPGSVLYIQNAIIAGNQGGGYAGGIQSQGTTTIVSTEVTDNSTSAASGGISSNNGDLHIRSSLIANNTANVLAGGIRSSGGVTTIENSTISGNTVTGDTQRGGGLFSDGGTFDLRNVTITNNTASDQGGGIYVGNFGWRMTNTLIAGNTSGAGADCFTPNGVSLPSGGGNLVQTPAGCDLTGNTAADVVGADPLLESLGDNGGLTRTHALMAGSPAIDAALLSSCAPQDQRYVLRPQGAGCDIGSVELGGVPPDVVWGDVNCDRRVDSRDGYQLLASEAGVLYPPVPSGCTPMGLPIGGGIQGDVNCDGSVDEIDMIAVLTFAAHIPHPEAPSTCPDVGDIVPG